MKSSQEMKDFKKIAIIVVYVAGFIILAGGLFYAIPSLLYPLIKGFQAQKWPKQECIILKKEVKAHSIVDEGIAYTVDIQYSYEFNGKNYLSSKYDFQNEFYNQYIHNFVTAQAIIDSFELNAMHTCYVNPKKPTEAVLSVNVDGIFKKLIVFLVSLFFSVGMVAVGISEQKNIARVNRGFLLNQTMSKTYSSRKVRLIYFIGHLLGVLAFLFVAFMVGNNEPNKINYIAVKIAFGAGVLVFAAMAIKSLFKVFILPVTVTLSTENIRIGETLKVSWKVGPKAEKISLLGIGIRCEGTYKDKESKKIESKTLHSEGEFISDKSLIKSGFKTYAIPDTDEIRNAVEAACCRWVFELSGIVDGYPYIDDEYEFEVYP